MHISLKPTHVPSADVRLNTPYILWLPSYSRQITTCQGRHACTTRCPSMRACMEITIGKMLLFKLWHTSTGNGRSEERNKQGSIFLEHHGRGRHFRPCMYTSTMTILLPASIQPCISVAVPARISVWSGYLARVPKPCWIRIHACSMHICSDRPTSEASVPLSHVASAHPLSPLLRISCARARMSPCPCVHVTQLRAPYLYWHR